MGLTREGEADPVRLALATPAAQHGGLLLTQVRREVAALATASDAAIAHIATFAQRSPAEFWNDAQEWTP